MRAPYPHITESQPMCWCVPMKFDVEYAPASTISDADMLDVDDEDEDDDFLAELGMIVRRTMFFHVDHGMMRSKHGAPAKPYYLEYRDHEVNS